MTASTGTLLGTWQNQYDSTVTITGDADGVLTGTFRTAIGTSPFAGHDVPLTGYRRDDALAFVCGAPDVDIVVSYTGKIDDGRMETLWIVLDGDKPWWTSATTNHDTFERIGD